MTITINQVANGVGLRINNDIYIITNFDHVKPGKGSAFVRLKLKNLKTGQVIEKTFKTADKLDDVHLEERKMQYLYRAGSEFHFMDQTTFEEQVLTEDELGDVTKFLLDDAEVSGIIYEGRCVKVNLPIHIHAKIAQTEPGLKGDSSRAGNKPAQIETGATLQVPLFIEIGDEVKIDTRTGEYVERVKK